MSSSDKHTLSGSAAYFLDITGEICPMTLVRTKLLVEAMAPGDIAEIRLNAGEALENIPRALARLGHHVIDKRPEHDGEKPVHRLVVRKQPA